MAKGLAPPELDDARIFETITEHFSSSRYDLDALLQRLARKEKMSAARLAEEWRKLASDMAAGKKPAHVNLYIHIPFCRHHCAYCGYYTLTPEDGESIWSYLEVLRDQARYFAAALGKTKIRNLFVGGGTPSFMNVEQTKYFVENVLSPFRYLKNGQRTIECDPFSITPEKIAVWKGSVLKRVSMGVESLNDAVLGAIGRTKSGIGASLGAVRLLREHDFAKDLNCDLLLGLVEDTPDSFLRSFRGLLEEGVAKIIVYGLKPIPSYLDKYYGGDWKKFNAHYDGMVAAVEERMKETAAEFGYVRHANSSFVWYFIEQSDIPGTALNRYEDDSSILPLSVLGLGSSARSRVYGYARYAQAHRLPDRFDPEEPVYLGRLMDEKSEMVRMILTSLRNKWRVSLSKFRSKFADDLLDEFACVVDGLKAEGRARVEEGYLSLASTEPREAMLAGMRFVGREEIESAFADVLRGAPVSGDGAAEAEAVPARARAAESPETEVLLDGTDWASPGYLQSLAEGGAARIGVVLHGLDEAGERAVTGKAGAFAAKTAGLGMLKSMVRTGKLKIPLTLHCAVCRPNMETLGAYAQRHLSGEVASLRLHYPGASFGVPLNARHVPTFSEAMRAVFPLILKNESSWKADLRLPGFPPCALPLGGPRTLSRQLLHHFARKYVPPAEAVAAGEEAGRKDPRAARKFAPFCRECTFFGSCCGIPKYALDGWAKEELKPVPENG